MSDEALRGLPSVDRVASDARLDGRAGSALATAAARQVVDSWRARVRGGERVPAFDDIVSEVIAAVGTAVEPPLRPLINATGVILHTNLGRAPLAAEAIEAIAAASRGYSNLEFDIRDGKRGSRHSLLEPLLCRLTGAEAAMAVNNNASAVLLVLTALAAGKEVVISRGQLVEIGGGFRIPDVMRQSRAKLVEVGTTNRTRPEDFEEALGAKTAAIMRVHPSNFRIVGFTASPALEELSRVATAGGVLLIDDIGSGCLLDTTAYGLPPEPTAQASIAAGADLVLFSGDKLLGGPQGGLIVGRRALIERLKRHPLARAMRLDKASIAGLAATLRLYLEGVAEQRVPVWRMIAMPLDAISARAAAIAGGIGDAASTVEGRSMIGGGSLPEEGLPTRLIALRTPTSGGATALAGRLRARGVVARIEGGRVLLDLRTVEPGDDRAVALACREALD